MSLPSPRHRVAAPHLPDVLQFMQLLWAVVHGLDRTSKHMRRTIGVTGPQRLVLRVVGLFPGLSAGDLAAILHIHPSTLTGVLQRLLAQRLLIRQGDSADRRRAVLSLTRRGARVNGRRAGTVEAAVTTALLGVSAPDRLTTRRVLARLAAHLGVTDAPGGVALAGHEPKHPRLGRRPGARRRAIRRAA